MGILTTIKEKLRHKKNSDIHFRAHKMNVRGGGGEESKLIINKQNWELVSFNGDPPYPSPLALAKILP